jgi:hypothetical protein
LGRRRNLIAAGCFDAAPVLSVAQSAEEKNAWAVPHRTCKHCLIRTTFLQKTIDSTESVLKLFSVVEKYEIKTHPH